jgi:hypothetical protein
MNGFRVYESCSKMTPLILPVCPLPLFGAMFTYESEPHLGHVY